MYVVPSFEDCPVCGARIPCGEIDDRSEWCRSNYYCSTCDHTFQKHVTFEIQSDEVKSEEWEDLPDDPYFEKEQRVFFMWNGGKERGRIWKRHLGDGTFHYHVDCLSVASGELPDIEHEFAERELTPVEEER